jgi:zeta-carotene desaturase
MSQFDAIIVGGGLAGLAAATALAGDGAKILLLERRPVMGGRAYSYQHPALGEVVDSQHVLLGCCTNLRELCETAGCGGAIRWYDELTFLEPSGRRSVMQPSGLPAPAHQTLSFLSAGMLGVKDKVAIAAGLSRFLRGYPADDHENFAEWLKKTGQTERAIRHFWEPVVWGALNDVFERCSTKYAGKVFHETFLRSSEGGRLGIPTMPLTEFFAPLVELARSKGVVVRDKSGADGLEPLTGGGWSVRSGSEQFVTKNVLLATNFRETRALLEGIAGANALLPPQGRLVSAPITTVHLWYDREVSELDHAVLLDTRIQWMFHKSRIRRWGAERGSYLELVISASWPELDQGRQEILSSAIAEAEVFFPKMREARLLKSGVLKEARATFSVTPGLDAFRPSQATNIPGLYIAGDWTRTEWPSTMEGAVRSGRLAAGAMVGDQKRFMAAEVRAEGLMRWLSRIG